MARKMVIDPNKVYVPAEATTAEFNAIESLTNTMLLAYGVGFCDHLSSEQADEMLQICIDLGMRKPGASLAKLVEFGMAHTLRNNVTARTPSSFAVYFHQHYAARVGAEFVDYLLSTVRA